MRLEECDKVDAMVRSNKENPNTARPMIRGRRITRGFIYMAGLAAMLATTLSSLPAMAEAIVVVVDRAKILRLTEPAGTIILGNPAIADATMSDDRTLVLTGKSYGTTNLVILDSNGEQIADETLLVRAPSDGMVVVYRGAQRQTMSCTPNCEKTNTVGDDKEAFEDVNTQVQARNGISQSAALGATSQQQR